MNVEEKIEPALSVLELSDPFHMCSVAMRFGLVPPAVETARVLEIGCGSGGSILPIASLLPDAKIVGIASDPHDVVAAKAIAEKMGVKNAHFWQLDWSELGPHLGEYDYIVCHDLFTRIESHLQREILSAISSLLTPSGVAYLSYDVKPGFDVRKMLANFISKKAAHFTKLGDRFSWKMEALFVLDELAKECKELDLLRHDPVYSNADDVLTSWMHAESVPLLFTDFARMLADHNLQFIGESDFFVREDLSPLILGSMSRTELERDRVRAEQYEDFVRCRASRRSLVCHSGLPLTLPDVRRLTATAGAYSSDSLTA